MQEIGKLYKVMNVQSGTTDRGDWVSQEFIIEVGETYKRRVAFSVFGKERVDALMQIRLGQDLRVTFYPESVENKDKTAWFTKLKCTQIEMFSSAFSQQNNG